MCLPESKILQIWLGFVLISLNNEPNRLNILEKYRALSMARY